MCHCVFATNTIKTWKVVLHLHRCYLQAAPTQSLAYAAIPWPFNATWGNLMKSNTCHCLNGSSASYSPVCCVCISLSEPAPPAPGTGRWRYSATAWSRAYDRLCGRRICVSPTNRSVSTCCDHMANNEAFHTKKEAEKLVKITWQPTEIIWILKCGLFKVKN